MAEYIEKKKALGIYVLKAFVVDDQGLECDNSKNSESLNTLK